MCVCDELKQLEEMRRRVLKMQQDAERIMALSSQQKGAGAGERGSAAEESEHGSSRSVTPSASSSAGSKKRGEAGASSSSSGDGEAGEEADRDEASVEEERWRQQMRSDGRSIFVNQVDYSTNLEELKLFFAPCGSVVRCKIITDKFGNPRGHAFVEFESKEAVTSALSMDGVEFKGRYLKVCCAVFY